jgi:glycosyltransferase involved in cell wall biosynthesis
MRLITAEKRWDHMAAASGYDRLADYLGGQQIRRQRLTSTPGLIISKAWEFLFGQRPHLLDYRFGDRIAEERIFWAALTQRADIIHILYGDEQLDLLLAREPALPSHLIATFHLPSTMTRERFERTQRDLLRRLSGAVVVASYEVAQFTEWLGEGKVMFVPHGIDVRAFPVGPGNSGDGLRLVFVGVHMRDFEVAHRVMDRCEREGIDVTLDAVLPQRHFGFFTGCDKVRCHSRVSDSDLLRFYHGADALFLPLVGATANNAVLESLSCGTPVISTRVGGLPDYMDEQSGWLLPQGDADAAFECVSMLAADRSMARAKRAAARQRAETMDWPVIAAQITAGYQRLLAGGHFAG